ncbi:ATP-dependent DNA helicase RecQ [Edaphobacter aggregans]|uniref:ATP-dependent DNA helicase RecQ n=1 Tax=Edaphobacter aggregans TaxID=570835 RepID=A0A428MCY3_9BACT|nr:RecQ family ATP-dependent DNA helicase [Edaphobacter aggregans]RSL14729.1 ATP-dependent DNA helicase RecQ [Edaphobacter aggregans]
MDLNQLLHKTFGFPNFRANQEAVCRAATEGRDVLLVMPTGAGKSLCYQLPAIARGGTALVISPLIALMDDQAAKLTALGLRVARIHSGLSRDEARQACRDYLDGTLQFLFIAPERMRVPNFPEMLAKRKPALIAIDEAHCISQWGHDFRPDYRTLGAYLPSLRPAPVIALTATATPTVQKDIVTQLQLAQPALFIHGFRRHNLAIEVVELSKPRRNQFTVDLLKSPANRPAIVYAPSRKAAEELASTLGGNAAAYHAGLDPGTRERVQRHFLSGKLEVVVATIAFGMGIDKADVRTVVHTALPGSVEAYYQEIGRAGRDGQPSRTVLLHSFADRKMHDFFLDRDYPAPTELSRVAAVLTGDYQMPDILRQRLHMDVETFDKAVEKLASQGAASINIEGNVRSTGHTTWRTGYDAQLAFRRSQIDRMAAFAETPQCRMTALIQHFGDTADGLRPCGHCDFCSPERATAQTFRAPSSQEDRQLRTILDALQGAAPRATGKLHSDLALGIDRKHFDSYLEALTRAGLITLTTDTFTSKDDGREITFKRAALTHEGRTLGTHEPLAVHIKDTTASTTQKSRKTSSQKPSSTSRKAEKAESIAAYTPNQKDLDARLREWRKAEAAKTGKPAFIVFSDTVLNAIVQTHPTTIPQLLNISGIGPDKADRHGAAVIAICTSKPIPGDYGVIPTHATPPKTKQPKTARSIASRYPKTSALGLSTGHEEGVLAPGATLPVETFTRPRLAASEPTDALTPSQQSLDQRLREWRRSESEKLGLPQFFVLGSSTLRSIVLNRPQTLTQLRSITGLNPEKAEKYGPAIIEVCTA